MGPIPLLWRGAVGGVVTCRWQYLGIRKRPPRRYAPPLRRRGIFNASLKLTTLNAKEGVVSKMEDDKFKIKIEEVSLRPRRKGELPEGKVLSTV